jgi:hypothetical protein
MLRIIQNLKKRHQNQFNSLKKSVQKDVNSIISFEELINTTKLIF